MSEEGGFREAGDMGCFDHLTKLHLRTTDDGRQLFRPWGPWGPDYVITSDQDFRRLYRQIKIYRIVALVMVVGSSLVRYSGIVFVAALLAGFQSVWMHYLARGLQPSGERASPRATSTLRAWMRGARSPWLWEIVVIALLSLVFIFLFVAPGERLIMLAAILLCGLCGAACARLFVLSGAGATRA